MKRYSTKIKKALSNDIPNWDDDAVWKGIESTLPPKKKNRKLFYLFAFIFLGLITSWFLYSKKPINTFTSQNKSFSQNSKDNDLEIETNNKTLKDNFKKETIIKLSGNTKDKTINFKIHESLINRKTFNKNMKSNSGFVKIENVEESKVNENFILKKNINENRWITFLSINKKISFVNNKVKVLGIELPKISSIPDLKIKNFLKSNYTLNFTTSIFYTRRSLSSSLYQSWVNKKIKTETMLESMEYSLNFQRNLPNNFSFFIGMNYSQVIEEFFYTDSTISVSQVYSDTAFVYPNGFYVGGMVNKTTIDYKTIKSPNRFRFLSIPIGINYNLPIRNNSIEIGCGVNIDFWSKYTGYSINLQNKTIYSTNKKNDFYKRPIGISSMFVHANYNIRFNNKISGLIGIKTIFDLKSNNVDKNISQKYNRYGIYLGIMNKIE